MYLLSDKLKISDNFSGCDRSYILKDLKYVVAKNGGLHKMFNWNKPMLTDSGDSRYLACAMAVSQMK